MPEDIVEDVTNLAANYHVSVASWSFIIFAFWGVGSLVYAFFFVSRGKVVPVLLGTYVAFWLTQFLPILTRDLAGRFNLELFELQLLAFAVIFLLVIFVLSRVILQSPVGAETFGVAGSLLLAVAQVGFLTAVLASFLPTAVTEEFSPLAARLFLQHDTLFYWALAPIVSLLFLGRKANREVG